MLDSKVNTVSEQRYITITPNNVPETLKLKLIGATGGKFNLEYGTKIVSNIPFNTQDITPYLY